MNDDTAAGYKLIATKKQDRGDDINYTRYVEPADKHGVKRMLEEDGYTVEVVAVDQQEMDAATQRP